MERVSVLIIEDHSAVREGIKSILRASNRFIVVAETGSTEKASGLMEHHQPDICLLDISLGEESGLDLLPQLKTISPRSKVAVHSMFARLDYFQQALQQGASGYFTKQSSPEVLIAGLELINRGEYFFDRHITELLMPEYICRPANIIETRHDDYDSLSHREQEVFRLLAEGHSNRTIASSLFISHRTVENYKSSILKKLALDNNAELVRYAQSIGIIQSGT